MIMSPRCKLYHSHTLSTLVLIPCLFSVFPLCHAVLPAPQYPSDNIPITDHQNDKHPPHQEKMKRDLNNEKQAYQVIAQRGKSDALRYIKNVYYNDKSNIKNYSKTEFWYWHEKAARQGDAESQFNLGYMYLYGKGVSHDYAKARYWFELSSIQNDPEAKYFLGLMYHEGKGINKTPEKAKILFQQSCADGLYTACCYSKIIAE